MCRDSRSENIQCDERTRLEVTPRVSTRNGHWRANLFGRSEGTSRVHRIGTIHVHWSYSRDMRGNYSVHSTRFNLDNRDRSCSPNVSVDFGNTSQVCMTDGRYAVRFQFVVRVYDDANLVQSDTQGQGGSVTDEFAAQPEGIGPRSSQTRHSSSSGTTSSGHSYLTSAELPRLFFIDSEGCRRDMNDTTNNPPDFTASVYLWRNMDHRYVLARIHKNREDWDDEPSSTP